MQSRLTVTFSLLMGIAATCAGQTEPPGLLPRPEGLTRFDPQTIQIERREDRWVIVAGQQVLKDCGRREQEAYQVWRLIQQLGLSQHGVIGGQQPIMEYWLAGGMPPTSLPRGLRLLPINLNELRLEQAQGFWVLREATRVLLNFGTEEQEGRQALAVIKKYGFNRVGVVGQGVPLMLLFVAHPEGSGLRTVSLGHEVKKKPEQDKPASAAQASFYPTPILPPVVGMQAHQPTALLNRGKPSRNALAAGTEAIPEVAVLGASAARATFDFRQTQVRRENGDWVLTAGGLTLARFGASERHARLAHAALMHYRLTEVHQIGSPEAGVRYFLSNGQTPRGLMIGVMGDNFQPDQVSVHQIGANYFVVQRGRALLNCGPKEEDARQMLGAIRRHGFDHICHIGQSDTEGMTLLVKSF